MKNPSSPQPIKQLHGQVSRGVYARGTKSEHETVFIEAADQRYVLRWKTGPAFGDRRFDKLIGKHVECDGFIVGDTLLADSVTLVKD